MIDTSPTEKLDSFKKKKKRGKKIWVTEIKLALTRICSLPIFAMPKSTSYHRPDKDKSSVITAIVDTVPRYIQLLNNGLLETFKSLKIIVVFYFFFFYKIKSFPQ